MVEPEVSPRDRAAAILVVGPAEDYVSTVTSLQRSHPEMQILCGGVDLRLLQPLTELGATPLYAPTLPSLVNRVWEELRGHVIVVLEAAEFPSRAFDPALRIVEENLRVATVSFLSNAGGLLSFPHRNRPLLQQPPGFDEELITRKLRAAVPELIHASLPLAMGPAVLLSSFALSASGPMPDTHGIDQRLALAELSARSRDRGFLDVLDPSTYIARLSENESRSLASPTHPSEYEPVFDSHPFLRLLLEEELTDDATPSALAHDAARATAFGTTVLIDGSCLGPREMGTQVQTLELIRALARRPDVERVAVALASRLPTHAESILSVPKVDARVSPTGDLSGFPSVDIVHRPYQPDEVLDLDSWRKFAKRTVVSVLDVIAYQVGNYHVTGSRWMEYRRTLREVAARVDGVVAPTNETASQIRLERLPIEDDRLFVVGLGVDHLTGTEADEVPGELLARGFAAEEFVLVLGANYGHKNRDLAFAVLHELHHRGFPLSLVLAGASVPFGSSRLREAQARRDLAHVVVMPDVSGGERNWLLRHASVVLYPSSAEGFGLVPCEAARFGTPTVLVPFGPLPEVTGHLPVTARDWSPAALADAVEALVTDPALADQQVQQTLSGAQAHTWDGAAAELVGVYRQLLARPPRAGH